MLSQPIKRVTWLRVALLGAVVGAMLMALVALTPGNAMAAGGFCNFTLGPGDACEVIAESTVAVADVEVTSGSGSVCAGARLSNGSIDGEACGSNRAYSEPNVFGKPWLKNNSNKTLTVAGYWLE
jgi:hypothetical protein